MLNSLYTAKVQLYFESRINLRFFNNRRGPAAVSEGLTAVSGLASLTLLWLGIVNKFPLLSLCATFKFQVSGSLNWARLGRARLQFYGHVSHGFTRIFSFILVIRAIRGVLFHGAPRIARIYTYRLVRDEHGFHSKATYRSYNSYWLVWDKLGSNSMAKEVELIFRRYFLRYFYP